MGIFVPFEYVYMPAAGVTVPPVVGITITTASVEPGAGLGPLIDENIAVYM